MGGGIDESLLLRFEDLPFKNKVLFTDRPYEKYRSAFYLKGYCSEKQVYNTYSLFGKRYIDQLDYVGWINSFRATK